MKALNNFFIFLIVLLVSCYSTQSSDKNSGKEKSAAAIAAADPVSETINIYGLIKTESENVYIVTNWKSRSMVTYTVTGPEKSGLAKNSGKYASVNGILTDKKTWSGTINIQKINSIDDSPDPRKEKIFRFIKKERR